MSDSEIVKAGGGIAPFGYRWVNGKLVIDENEAPVRKLIYELFIKHRRKKTVARILNELGHQTRRGFTFYDTTILRLLTDTAAKGVWIVDGKDVRVDAIVSIELWDRANTILRGTKPAKQPVRLFHGILHCECGSRMLRSSTSENYICVDCRQKILADDLESIFHSQLDSYTGTETEGIQDNWMLIGLKEKRILIEQICERIVIDKSSIEIVFTFDPKEIEVSETVPSSSDANEIEIQSESVLEQSREERLLSEAEAADFLDISVTTLSRKRKAGEIKYFQVGRLKKYSKLKHLMPYLGQRERKGPAA